MKNDLISVIVPVYKVEKYLDECVSSIVNQTHKNLEIILVDDGSPDNCPLICDQWAERDGRIKVIHKENGGQSSARNAGLDIATGEYIGFVDSDDYVCSDMYETLLSALLEGGKKTSCCLTHFVFENGRIVSETRKSESNVTLDVAQAVNESFFNHVGNAVWCKLSHRTVWEKTRFAEGETNEDYPIIIPNILASDGLVLVRRALYYYRKRQGSITNRSSSSSLYKKVHIIYKNLMTIREQIEENGLPCKRSGRFFTSRTAFSVALLMEKDYDVIDEEAKGWLKKFKALMRENAAVYIFSSFSSLKDKALYLLVLTRTLKPVYKLLKKTI